MEPLEFIGILIALTVLVSSLLQKWLDRATQRVFRIHDWGNDCISALTEAQHFCLVNESDFSDNAAYALERMSLLRRLSALIDRGRIFYRNIQQDEDELERENWLENFRARPGHRPEILDPLVHAYRAVKAKSGSGDQDRADLLYRWRGRFITLLQCEANPHWLRKAQYYRKGPGAAGGVSLKENTEPPPWPKDRPIP